MFTELQQQAITLAETCRVMILTGGPGTGKTTTICGIIDRMDALGLTVALCAPTGRAAQRMAEATGRHAQTIHRLLRYHPHHGFTRNEDNPLSEDVIIVDEFSMVDVRLAAALTAAIPDGARLIIVGDRDQLPSVGPGRVLHDLIESGTIPTVCLTKIHRQQGGSSIIDNAHRVIHGDMPVTDNMPGQDFFWLATKPNADGTSQRHDITEEESVSEVLSMVSDRLPRQYPGSEIQVLTPRKTDIATSADQLNPLLQNALNPHGRPMKVGQTELREGDRTIQTKNDYDLMRFNGDIGRVSRVQPDHKTLTVSYPDQPTRYEGIQAYRLALAYALTIHKSQGSEYDVVVIPLLSSATVMLQRNLLYTAITRAKKVCILVGPRQAVRQAVENWMQKERNTALGERLTTTN